MILVILNAIIQKFYHENLTEEFNTISPLGVGTLVFFTYGGQLKPEKLLRDF